VECLEHRADISPLAVLGVALVTASRADVSRTSLEHAYDIAQAKQRCTVCLSARPSRSSMASARACRPSVM
jgi:hypothetical protein